MNRRRVFGVLGKQLKRKGITKEEILEAERELNDYIERIEARACFSFSLPLEKLVTARR